MELRLKLLHFGRNALYFSIILVKVIKQLIQTFLHVIVCRCICQKNVGMNMV